VLMTRKIIDFISDIFFRFNPIVSTAPAAVIDERALEEQMDEEEEVASTQRTSDTSTTDTTDTSDVLTGRFLTFHRTGLAEQNTYTMSEA